MKAEYYVGHRQAAAAAAAAAAAVCSACQFSTSVSGSTAGLAIKIGINSKQTINPLFLCLIMSLFSLSASIQLGFYPINLFSPLRFNTCFPLII